MPTPRINLIPLSLLMGVRYGSYYHICVVHDFKVWRALKFFMWVWFVTHPW